LLAENKDLKMRIQNELGFTKKECSAAQDEREKLSRNIN